MKRLILTLVVLIGATLASRPALAGDRFDSTGWTLLGEQTVSGRHDEDLVKVGRREGRFSKLTLVVLENDLNLVSMKVTFTNGETQLVEVKQYFAEGSRTRAINLTGDARTIDTIALVYGTVGRDKAKGRKGNNDAKVQIWGLEVTSNAWNASGWDLIAKKKVTAKKGTFTLKVSQRDAKYNRLSLVISDGDLKITDVDVTYAKGPRRKVRLGHDFRGEQRHRAFDLEGEQQVIKSVTVSYANRTGGKFANISVFGQEIAPPPPPPPAWRFNNQGWTLLGEQTVTGKHDRDTIKVGRDDGKFSRIAVVVLDADLELNDLVVHVGGRKGESVRPKLKQHFKEGERSREIDLPGGAVVIQSIDLSYGTTRGGGRARLQVWGR